MATEPVDLDAFLAQIEAEQGIDARRAVERGLDREPVRKKPVPKVVGVPVKHPKPIPQMPSAGKGLSWKEAAEAAREAGAESWWEKANRKNRERNRRIREQAEDRRERRPQ